MRRTVWMPASLSLMLLTSGLRAQTAPTINPGDRVRLSARSLGTESRVGILTKVEAGKLVLVEPTAAGVPWEIQLDRLDGLEVRVPNASDHRHRGALIGMITGIVTCGVAGYYATRCKNGCDFDRMGVLAAGPGGGLGAYLGYQIGMSRKSDGWVRVPLPLKFGASPGSSHTFRFSGSFTF